LHTHTQRDRELIWRGDARDAAALMKPAAEDVLQMWPVSKRVNSSRADGDAGPMSAFRGRADIARHGSF
jgi:hypothetical protein